MMQEDNELELVSKFDDENYSYKLFDFHQIIVDAGQQPLRIDKFLLDRLEKVSRNRIQNALNVGTIKVGGKEVKPNYKVKPNDVILLYLPKPYNPNEEIEPNDIPLDIRYEDEDILIIHKPAGMVVHPGVGHHNGTLVNALAFYLKEKQAMPIKEGNMADRPGLVHRIDKDTSGLLVVAKNEYAMTHLAKQFFDHSIHRTYQAIVWGEPWKDEGSINLHVGRDPNNRLLFRGFPDSDGGKFAITHYKVLEKFYYVSLLECRLETGRTHQIRVHFNHLGNPLFADGRYGGLELVKGTVYSKYKQFVDNCFKILPRQALHAKSLGIVHPRTEEYMFFDSELPADMTKCLEKWRDYIHTRKDALNAF